MLNLELSVYCRQAVAWYRFEVVADLLRCDRHIACNRLLHGLRHKLFFDNIVEISSDLVHWLFVVFLKFLLAAYLFNVVVYPAVELGFNLAVGDFDSVENRLVYKQFLIEHGLQNLAAQIVGGAVALRLQLHPLCLDIAEHDSLTAYHSHYFINNRPVSLCVGRQCRCQKHGRGRNGDTYFPDIN